MDYRCSMVAVDNFETKKGQLRKSQKFWLFYIQIKYQILQLMERIDAYRYYYSVY